jgi:amidase
MAAEIAAKACENLGHEVEQTKWNFDGRELMRAFLIIIMNYTHRDVVNIARLLGVSEKSLDVELNTKFLSVAGSGMTEETVEKSLAIWRTAARKMSELHKQFDVILTPTVATPPLQSNTLDPNVIEKLFMRVLVATGLGKKVINKNTLEMIIDKSVYQTPFTPIANITGQPAMSVPLHWDKYGLPHGAQFMADIGDDKTLFMLGHQLETECPWVNRIPHEI